MSIPSNGWMPQAPQNSPAFEPAPANAYGEETQVQKEEEGSFLSFLFGDDGADIYDVLDVVNPLQHIPGVNTLYLELTGYEIGHGARMAGATLYGGVFGLAASAVNATVDAFTGRDVSEHAMAMYQGEAAEPADTPLMAGLFSSDTETALSEQGVELAAQQAVPIETALVAEATPPAPTPVSPVAEAPPVRDGMSHFAAFRPNGELMSPAELAAKLNQQQAAERQSVVDRVEEFDNVDVAPQADVIEEAAPIVTAAATQAPEQPSFPTEEGEKPNLAGNWFDTAMMDALVKYQEMKQGQSQQPL